MNKTEIRVRYQETDQMGMVYNANYFVWFEVGRTSLCRSLGVSYREMEGQGVALPVVEARCKYKKPAVYDDLVTVETVITNLTPVRIQFSYRIFREDELLVEGDTTHAFTTREAKLLKLSKTHPPIWAILQKAALAEE
ncbi:MAG: acyl-CoA thioesterase [Clostridia bacterium]|nr:acyl-CoA thioesterase [Clostridia bacterium]